jgi:hypothetical protein
MMRAMTTAANRRPRRAGSPSPMARTRQKE